MGGLGRMLEVYSPRAPNTSSENARVGGRGSTRRGKWRETSQGKETGMRAEEGAPSREGRHLLRHQDI